MNMDEINYALQNIGHRKLRSLLTIISILIGITAIYALISFGLGIQDYVTNVAAESGTDKLFIQARSLGAPGTDETFYISQDDIDFVERINGVQDISGLYAGAVEIRSREKSRYNFLIGIDTKQLDLIMETFTTKVDSGRNLKDGDKYNVVLGYNYQLDKKIFEKGLQTGDRVDIAGAEFRVVGFYSLIGNPQDDANIYITKEAFEELYPDKKDKYGFAMIRAEKDADVEQVADRIQDRLRRHKGQEEGKEDFFVQTFADALATFNSIIIVINGILVLIALISVVVASVNIMNTMYTAVLERTKEIGIMKAVGATRKDIIFIFIFESGVLGAIGGAVGVMLGYALASFGGSIAAASGFALLKPVFPWYLTVGCIFFAYMVGTVSGILPAVRASKLRPVDALRYE